VPNAVSETVTGDVARLLVVFPEIERAAFVSPLLAAIVARDDGLVAHRLRAGHSHQGRPIAGARAVAGRFRAAVSGAAPRTAGRLIYFLQTSLTPHCPPRLADLLCRPDRRHRSGGLPIQMNIGTFAVPLEPSNAEPDLMREEHQWKI
jgi:hypothetical protein